MADIVGNQMNENIYRNRTTNRRGYNSKIIFWALRLPHKLHKKCIKNDIYGSAVEIGYWLFSSVNSFSNRA